MAIRYAIKNGNWSDPTTWDGATTLPAAADEVRSNTFTVTVDVNTLTTTPTIGTTTIPFSYQVGKVTATKNGSAFTDFTATNGTSVTLNVATNGTDIYVFRNAEWQIFIISNKSETSPVVTGGGTFLLTNGVTLRATSTGIASSTSINAGFNSGTVINFLEASPSVANIICVNTRTTVGGATAVTNSSSGRINITGNAELIGYAGNTANSTCFLNNSSGVISIVGNVSGGDGMVGIVNASAGTVSIQGKITGGTGGGVFSQGCRNSSSGTINVLSGSTLSASQGYEAIVNSSSGVVNILTNIVADSPFGYAGTIIKNTSVGTINITGNITGATTAGGYVFSNDSSGTVNHSGSVIAGSGSPAIAPGSTSQLTFLTGPFIGHPNSTQANIAAAWRWNLANPATYIEVYSSDLLDTTPRTLYTADFVGGNPSVADVRAGTTFGPAAELTGTMVVPAPEFVEGGVEVDDTVGTAITTGAEVWNAPMGLVSGAVGTVGERLKNTATIQSVGAQIEALGA